MRRALARLLGIAFSLPALGGALIALTTPPLSPILPRPVRQALAPMAGWLFSLVATLPPDSLVGRAFYGSYAPLARAFGADALAIHALLWSLPWLLVGLLLLRRGRSATRSSTRTSA